MRKILHTFLFLFAVLLLTFNTSLSQERTITGTVTGFKAIPLQAEIYIFSSNEVVYTTDSGTFIIQCLPKDKIQVSADGWKTKTVKIKKKTNTLAIDLVAPKGTEHDVVNVGYGQHKYDKNKVNPITSEKDKKNDFSMYTDMYELIKNKFPTVRVENGEIIIRGYGSFHISNSALIVVDGTVTSSSILSFLQPSNVESITIMKDASIYGSRGANGAIIIETKKGE